MSDLNHDILVGDLAAIRDSVADPDQVLEDRRRPLSLAAAAGRTEVLGLFVELGAPLDARDDTKRRASARR